MYLSIYLFIYLSIYPSIYLSVCLSIHPSILFYAILFYAILFYAILCYSILCYSMLFYSILVYSILSIYPSLSLSVCLSVCPSVCLSVCLSLCLCVSLSLCLSISVSIYLSICLSLSLCLSITLSIYLSVCLSIYLSIYQSIRPSILSVYLQAWKQSNSARHLHFSNLTTSKTKQICETSSIFWTWQHPKRSNSTEVRSWCALWILTSKRASRHNGVHFFDIATSKSGPELVCFVNFDFEMCFAPQWRALFRHTSSNFQKWSEAEVFCTFWLGNVLRATTACTFSYLIWPAGSAPAALASLLFDPPEPQIIGKTQCFATFLPFREPASSFFWLFLFSDLLSSTRLFSLTLSISAFHLSILSEVWLLNFLRLIYWITWCQL